MRRLAIQVSIVVVLVCQMALLVSWSSMTAEKEVKGDMLHRANEPLQKLQMQMAQQDAVQKGAGVGAGDAEAEPAEVTEEEKVADEEDVQEQVKEIKAMLYSEKECGGEELVVTMATREKRCPGEACFDTCNAKFPSGSKAPGAIKSIRVMDTNTGRGYVDLHRNCEGSFSYDKTSYFGSVFAFDDCVNVDYVSIGHVRLHTVEDLPPQVQVSPRSKATPTYRVVYSAESSMYMGYQAWANYYGFLTTQPDTAATTRLLTAREPDDLASVVPTFQGKRHPFSKTYSPINKPDVLVKWFLSSSAPTEEVIVLIDPDNWLTQDLSPIVSRVSRGHPVAQSAWFHGNSLVQRLWSRFCETNCAFTADAPAVPIFIHRDDLADLAPLWRHYTERISRESLHDGSFREEFKSIQIGWGAEMLGYVCAAAHLGLRHAMESRLQLRDVSPRVKLADQSSIYMIHMGRAWFPKDYAPGEKWTHTEGSAFKRFGRQVWCKCNRTAAVVKPWPVPPGTDFVSNVTLTYLHEADTLLGPIPHHPVYRQAGYNTAFL